MSVSFSLLHPKIQEAIYRENWQALRPLQRDAIQAVFNTNDDLILAASTASGKTEAAFLPILSKVADNPSGGVKALYVSPLKALINDQFRRLERLCELADIPVHRWHGDVNAPDKAKLRKEPGGVLLITPESLESQFVNYDRHLTKLYHALEFVVIDELHAFLDNVRGIHLRSLLSRLAIAASVAPRRVGLSATLGDFAAAQQFLRPGEPASVSVLQDASQVREKRVGLKAFLDVSEKVGSEQAESIGGLAAVAEDLAKRFRRDANLVFCNSRRQTELLADKLHQIESREHWAYNPFLMHHGSLSRDIREDAEVKLKSGNPVTALCTSTLEMGIDIGSVKSVGQVGPPWTVASLVQRLGRSGREEGQRQILRLYTLDMPVDAKSCLSDRLYPELIRSIAMVELFLAKWLEPPEVEKFHFSTCLHQVLSILRQTGGILPLELHRRLCTHGAFGKMSAGQFKVLVRGMAQQHLIEQVPTDELILAPVGERIVEKHDFYAAFASRIEYTVECDGQPIGVLPVDSIPVQGEFMILAGRRWKVELIDHAAKRVLVLPAKGWKQPRFSGSVGTMHPVVMAKMKEVLADDGGFPYLHETAVTLLKQARQVFNDSFLRKSDAIIGLHGIEWFPWAGTRVLQTLELYAKAEDLSVERDEVCLTYSKLSGPDFAEHCRRIAEGAISPASLLEHVPDFCRDRFDEFVPIDLLRDVYAAEVLDIENARLAARSLMHGL